MRLKKNPIPPQDWEPTEEGYLWNPQQLFEQGYVWLGEMPLSFYWGECYFKVVRTLRNKNGFISVLMYTNYK